MLALRDKAAKGPSRESCRRSLSAARGRFRRGPRSALLPAFVSNDFETRSTQMFDVEQFTADCRAALKEGSSHKSVREVVARAVADPSGVLKALGEPSRAGIQKLYHGPD